MYSCIHPVLVIDLSRKEEVVEVGAKAAWNTGVYQPPYPKWEKAADYQKDSQRDEIRNALTALQQHATAKRKKSK